MGKRIVAALVLFLLFAGVLSRPVNSEAASKTAVGKVTITSVKINDEGLPVVKWKAVTGATGYQVFRKTASKVKWEKVSTIDKLSVTDKKLSATPGMTVHYRVRAYTKNKTTGKIVYGKYSKAKKTTIPASLVLEYLGDHSIEITSSIIRNGKTEEGYNPPTFYSKETVRTAIKKFVGKEEIVVADEGDPEYEEFMERIRQKYPDAYIYADIMYYLQQDGKDMREFGYYDDEGHFIYLIHGENEQNGLFGEVFLGYYGEDIYENVYLYTNGYRVSYEMQSGDGKGGYNRTKELGSEAEEIDLGISGTYAFITAQAAYLYVDTDMTSAYGPLKIECTIKLNNENEGYATLEEYRNLLKKVKEEVMPKKVDSSSVKNKDHSSSDTAKTSSSKHQIKLRVFK